MAALVTIIAGRYSSTYGGSDLGVTNDPGYKLAFTPSWEKVTNTDAYAAAVIEGIWLGLSAVTLDFTTKEIKAGPAAAIKPLGTSYGFTGAQTFSGGLAGIRATDNALSVVMSSTASTPAASTPASMTFLYAMIADGVPIEQIYGPRHRTIPIKFEIIANGTTVANYWTAT